MKKIFIAALMLGILGCATTPSQKLYITGDSLVSMATTFDVVSRHMTSQCTANVYTKQTCTQYRLFGEKFKLAYPVAKSLWNTGTQYEDKGLIAAAESALGKLSNDLAPFLAMMGGK